MFTGAAEATREDYLRGGIVRPTTAGGVIDALECQDIISPGRLDVEVQGGRVSPRAPILTYPPRRGAPGTAPCGDGVPGVVDDETNEEAY
jgi:hypothetical protein